MSDARRASALRQVELVDAALHIIETRGIAALSTRSLAEEVGLTSGAIFRHFASLDDLLDAVVARVEAVLEATYPPHELEARERLERFVVARSTAVGSQVGILRLMLSEQFSLALPEGGSSRLANCVRRTREFVLGCIRQGQADKTIRSDIDAAALTVVVMGTVQMLAFSPLKLAGARAVYQALNVLLSPSGASRKSRKVMS